jgi:hypothetical protein
VLEQRLHQPGAAVNHDVAVVLPPQPRDLLRDVPVQDGGVVPLPSASVEERPRT